MELKPFQIGSQVSGSYTAHLMPLDEPYVELRINLSDRDLGYHIEESEAIREAIEILCNEWNRLGETVDNNMKV